MRIPLRRGRLLDARDGAGSPSRGRDQRIVREAPVSRPGSDRPAAAFRSADAPVGRHRRRRRRREAGLARGGPDRRRLSSPTTQWSWAGSGDVARRPRARRPAALAPAVTGAIWSVDKDQPIARVATMDALLAASAAERRFALIAVRGVRRRRARARGRRHLRRAVGQRHRAHARDRRAGRAGRVRAATSSRWCFARGWRSPRSACRSASPAPRRRAARS